MKLNARVAKINLPENNTVLGEYVEVAGWGIAAPNTSVALINPDILQVTRLRTIDDHTCEMILTQMIHGFYAEVKIDESNKIEVKRKEKLLKMKVSLDKLSFCTSDKDKGICKVC